MSDVLRFDLLRTAVLIGGGDLMLHAALAFHRRGVAVIAVMAPRHAEENLPLDGRPAHDAYAVAGVPIYVTADMAANRAWETTIGDGAAALALCFGPAWVFPRQVIDCFGLGMMNFNGIPVPRYLGGAHYSWQILNGDRSGGCIVQLIDERLDRGDVLRAEYFDLPKTVRIPLDYFEANHRQGVAFLDRLADDMVAGVPFQRQPFAEFESERLYFPRLLTAENAYLDWSWLIDDVERFCAAFDRPYAGAATFLGERLVRLRDVRRVEHRGSFHPFSAGLVVRRHSGKVYVAARGGLLEVATAVDAAGGADVLSALREGARLHTDAGSLARARTFRPRLGAAKSEDA